MGFFDIACSSTQALLQAKKKDVELVKFCPDFSVSVGRFILGCISSYLMTSSLLFFFSFCLDLYSCVMSGLFVVSSYSKKNSSL